MNMQGARQKVIRYAGPLALAIVVTAPAVASWRGLMLTGRDWFGLPGAWAVLVPLSLDAAALYVATLALRATLRGDSARVDRLLIWIYAGISAALNVTHADQVGGIPAALFYGVVSASAVLLYERTLRALNRDRLYERGEIDPPAPRFRVLRWLLWRKETWRAFKLAIRDNISSPRDAITHARGELTPMSAVPEGQTNYRALVDQPGGKRQAVESAADEVGSYDPQTVVEWLSAEHQVDVDYSYARRVLLKLTEKRRRDLVQLAPAAEG